MSVRPVPAAAAVAVAVAVVVAIEEDATAAVVESAIDASLLKRTFHRTGFRRSVLLLTRISI